MTGSGGGLVKGTRLAGRLLLHLLPRHRTRLSIDGHIEEAVRWILLAQKASGTGGVSKGFHLYHGWLSPYPETTGYIIESLCDWADHGGGAGLKDRVGEMADWLCSVQREDGSIPESSLRRSMVFDTGQVLFGLLRAAEATGRERYLQAAVRAADWIVAQQESDGSWVRGAYNGIPHAYYTRVAWALLLAHRATGCQGYAEAAARNIEWALSRRDPSGWFDSASFTLESHEAPYTHTVAYTVRGILEAGILLGEQRYVSAARATMERLLPLEAQSGAFPGTVERGFGGDRSYTCVTGNAQLSIILFTLHRLEESPSFQDAALRLNGRLKELHSPRHGDGPVRGGMPGSVPIWGAYMPWTYPNWACKFFIDALLAEKDPGTGTGGSPP